MKKKCTCCGSEKIERIGTTHYENGLLHGDLKEVCWKCYTSGCKCKGRKVTGRQKIIITAEKEKRCLLQK